MTTHQITHSTSPRETLLSLYHTALQAVHGRTQVAHYLQQHPPTTPVALIAIGKAASQMALGAFDVLDHQITPALVVTKTGHLDRDLSANYNTIISLETAHPVPDASSLAAGSAVIDFISKLPNKYSLLFLLSGGTSALVEVLAPGISLTDLQRVNEWLLASGLDIHAINQIRKSLSMIKGGRLAGWLKSHQKVLNLIISDVPGDDLQAIGSGLLTWHEPLKVPSDLPSWLQQLVAKTPPLAPPNCFTHIEQYLVAGPAIARQAVAEAAESLGYEIGNYSSLMVGEAESSGRTIAQHLRAAKPGIYVWSSETTVHLPPQPGQGGRCQTLALAAAAKLSGMTNIYLLAAGTDGNDGPGEAAGAIIDTDTIARGTQKGWDVQQCLATADAGSFLAASGDLLYTGPTGTNVMDLLIGMKLR